VIGRQKAHCHGQMWDHQGVTVSPRPFFPGSSPTPGETGGGEAPCWQEGGLGQGKSPPILGATRRPS